MPETSVVSTPEIVFVTETGEQITQKECTACHFTKPLAAFHQKTRGRYKRQEWCKRCMKHLPPLSWEAELAEKAAQNGHSVSASPANKETDVDTASTPAEIADTIQAVLDAETSTITEGNNSTTPQQPTLPGDLEFSEWLQSDFVVFSNPLITVLRLINGDETTYTVYVNTAASIPAFIPTGEMHGARTVELIVRAIADNISGEPNVHGFTYN